MNGQAQAPNRKSVVFVGPTGTGKSTIIHSLTHNNEVKIGHSLRSETTEIKPFAYRDFDLYDTPGLGDSEGRDQIFLDKMVEVLQGSCHGIHRIYFCLSGHERRFNSSIKDALNVLMSLFPDLDPGMLKIVFTHCDEVRDREQLRTRWSELPELKNGAIMCGLGMYNELLQDLNSLDAAKFYQTGFMKKTQTMNSRLQELEAKVKASQANEEKLNSSIKDLHKALARAKDDREKLELYLQLRESMESQLEELRQQVHHWQEKCREMAHQHELGETERRHVVEKYQSQLEQAQSSAKFNGWDAVPVVGALVRLFK